MGVGFGVLKCYTQVEYMRIEYETIFRYLEAFYLIMPFCIQYMVFIGSERWPQVHIVGVAAQAVAIVGSDDDGAFFYLL